MRNDQILDFNLENVNETVKILKEISNVQKRVISREQSRIAERLQNHFNNKVWEHRTTPPEDWNRPLPTHLAEACEESYLKTYKDEQGQKGVNQKVAGFSAKVASMSCAIM